MADSLGEIVKVPSSQISLDDMSATIESNVQKTWTMVDSIYAQLNTSLLNLAEVVGEYQSKLEDIDTEFMTIDGPQFPERPDFAKLVLDSAYPDGYIPEPINYDYGNLDFNIVVPTPPNEVDEGFTWVEGEYTSENWQSLFSLVQTHMISGNYGLSEDAQSALVAMEQETRRRNQEREYLSGLAAVGAAGFNMPGGHISAFISEFQNEVLSKDQDALNNITAKSFDIANDREKFFVGTALDAEKMLRDFFDKVQTRSLAAAQAAKEYVWKFFSENIKLFLGKYEGEKIRLESFKIKVDAISAANKSETDKFLGKAQVLEAKIRAITEKNRGLVDARKGEIETYAVEVEAVKSEYLALVEEVKIHHEALSKQIDKEIAIENVNLTAYVERTKLLSNIGINVSNVLSQGLASTIGAMNWTLSNSYSGSESKSIGWSASLTESISTNETTSTSETTTDSTVHQYVYQE